MNSPLYPLLFVPIFKDRIWGGEKLHTHLNKNIPNATTGESWELSSVAGDVSLVQNGNFQGKSLTQLVDEFPEAILGKKVYRNFGKQFPLLFKFLDAKEDLSIQLHPNDILAKQRHNSFGKTEMWYVVHAEKDARLIVGFKEDSTPEQYLKHVQEKSLLDILDTIPVQKGDVFLLETGTIHAIGAGVLIAEIQQTSDITYRIYDFDRRDEHGNLRELHNDLALEAINYQKVSAYKPYEAILNSSIPVVECPYFTTNVIALNGSIAKQHSGDSFRVYMCTEGTFTIAIQEEKYTFQKGDTILLPAMVSDYQLIGVSNLLEIYIA